MRIRTSLAIISVLCATDALAAGVAPNSRTRPGSVTGALLQNAQTAARMPGLDVNNCPGCQPTPTPIPTPTPNPCGEVIPQLGVDICVARSACAGIKADGHNGVFDEVSLTCKIPVCAHNWSGIIKKDGADVCGFVNMNTALRCDANLFDQIDVMRRTSQWVVPLTVAGGAGIGAGVGAIIDSNQDKKAAALAAKSDANDGLYKELNASVPNKITFMGVDYDLSQDADRQKLKDTLNNSEQLKNKIVEANELVDSCALNMFKELVSVNVKGNKKFGRIKISENMGSCLSDNNDYIYCQFQNLHSTTDKTADCDKGQFSTARNINPTYTPAENSTNPKTENFSWGHSNNESNIPNGTCYFRDSQGSGEVNEFATVQADLWRMEFLLNYRQNAKTDAIYNSEFRRNLQSNLMQYDFQHDKVNASGIDAKILNYVLVTGPKFSTILNMTAPRQCSESAIKALLPDKDYVGDAGTMSGGRTNNILMEAYGALSGLQQFNGLDDNLEAFLSTLNFIDVHASAAANINEGLGSDIEQTFGEKRGFFQKAVGRGLLIGTGVGAAAGLGYWFAEGASTFCNVGGLEQVKLGKSYSVQSFRDYLYNKGFIK